MSERIEQTVVTQSGLADAGTFQATVDTDGADRVLVFVDDNAGGSPASYNLDVEVAYNGTPDYMPRSSVSSSTATHIKYTDVAPFEFRFTFENASGGAADYRVRIVSIAED